jgi:uncharacterized protein YdhG (YjbR/CyaY superfamily)
VTAASIDEYLAGVSDLQRAALEQLRQQIRAGLPEATEGINYGLPAFRLDGRYFVGFGATREGCSFYAGRAPLLACARELAGYRLGKGTINFDPGEPLPADLVAKLVEVRRAEFRAR